MKPPVFVLGCPRSGTTLLYYMLLSSGGFAVYPAESLVFNILIPRFGDPGIDKNKRKLMDRWLRSSLFRLSGLEANQIETRILSECKSGGDFLRIVMEAIAEKQHVDRWAECTPDHLLYIPEIKREVPEAQFIHIIRDGRDVALSYVRQNWIQLFPWDKKKGLLVAGLYWEWTVRKGREYGRRIQADYREVRFEELIAHPRETLSTLSGFLNHDLNYDHIQSVAMGSVGAPNTSFKAEFQGSGFNPVGRWKQKFSSQELAMFEGLMGELLEELGYPLATSRSERANSFEQKSMSVLYRSFFETKLWLKSRTPLGRYLVSTDLLEIVSGGAEQQCQSES